jgi:hypothetical protein
LSTDQDLPESYGGMGVTSSYTTGQTERNGWADVWSRLKRWYCSRPHRGCRAYCGSCRVVPSSRHCIACLVDTYAATYLSSSVAVAVGSDKRLAMPKHPHTCTVHSVPLPYSYRARVQDIIVFTYYITYILFSIKEDFIKSEDHYIKLIIILKKF